MRRLQIWLESLENDLYILQRYIYTIYKKVAQTSPNTHILLEKLVLNSTFCCLFPSVDTFLDLSTFTWKC